MFFYNTKAEILSLWQAQRVKARSERGKVDWVGKIFDDNEFQSVDFLNSKSERIGNRVPLDMEADEYQLLELKFPTCNYSIMYFYL